MHVYLDNAATTALYPEVYEAMKPYLSEFYGNPSSIHATGRKARAAIEQARKTIARLVGASAAEIIFTSGGTEADNIFLQGIAPSMPPCNKLTNRTPGSITNFKEPGQNQSS